MDELSVLVEQLDELLIEGAVNGDQALEIAVVAGLAARLEADPEAIAAAEAWRDGLGRELLDEGFQEADVAELVQAIDQLTIDTDDVAVEEAVYDFDDMVAAADWCGRLKVVRAEAQRVAEIVRQIPEIFQVLAYDGREMSRMRIVGQDPGLYGYWFALADAAEWAETA